MKRGDIVIVAPPGDFGKPRPAVVVQSDILTEGNLQSVVLCLMSSVLVDAPLFRIHLDPNDKNGLDKPSQIMVDKLLTVARPKVGQSIGCLSDEELVRLNRTLAFVLGLG